MAVTAVTITSGPTVVGRSVTISGTLDRDGGGTNNNLNFLCYSVGYVAVYTITKLSDSSTFLNAAGTAGSGIAWTWTGTLPEGDYLTVTVNLNEAPYTTLAATAGNVGLVQLRRPLPGIWTPQRDSRGLFVELPDRRPVAYKDYWNDSVRANKRKTYHYATPDGQIYWSATDNLARLGEYGNMSSAMPTPYGVGIDVPQGWEWPVGTKGSTSAPGGYSTNVITYISVFYLYNSQKYHDPVASSKFAAILGDSQASSTNAFGYWSNPNGEQAIKFGLGFGSWGEALQNITVNNVGNGLHCLVVVQCNDTRSNGHRVFLDGQLVGSATYTTTYLGGLNIRPYYFWGSLSKSGLDIGTVLFQGSIDKLYPSDEQAIAISKNPFKYFFRDAPKTSAKRRLFGGVLSLPDPLTEFTSTKAGRVQPRVLTQQPQGAVQIDWSNPLARGITFAQIGNQTQDVVFNGRPTLIGSIDSRIDQYGRGLSLAGSNAFVYPNQSKYFPTTQVSVLSITRPATGQAANTSADIFGRATTAVGQAWGLGFYVSGFGTNGFALNIRNSGGFSYGASAGIGDNYQYTRPFVVSGSAGTNQSGKLYVDGVLKGTQTPLNDTLYSPGSAVGLAIGSTNGSTASYNGSTFLNVVWNRTLTDSEHLQLAQNPWQLFKPAAGRLYFLPATTTQFKGGRFLPQRWKTQPQGNAKINWNHPVTKDLFFAYLPGNPKNLAARQGDQAIIEDTGHNPLYTGPSGRVSYYERYYSNNNYYTGPFTMGFPGQLYGTTSSQLYLLTDTSYNWYSSIQLTSGNTYQYIGYITEDLTYNVRAVSVNGDAEPLRKRTRFLATTFQAGNPLKAFLGNTQIGTGLSTWDGTITVDSSFIGGFDAAGGNATGGFANGGFIWRRVLSENELGMLDENPWQLFAPKSGRTFFLPGMTKRGKFLFLFS